MPLHPLRLTAGLSALVLLLSACGGSRRPQSAVMDATPSWYRTVQPVSRDKGTGMILGRGAGSSASQQIALDMAKMSAMTDLGRTLDAQFSGLSKQAMEQVGAGQDAETVQHFSQATKVVMADIDVAGTAIANQYLTEVNGLFYAWILLEYPLGEANRKFLDDLKANRRTWERFRATQLYDEMNVEVEKYRQFREQQRR